MHSSTILAVLTAALVAFGTATSAAVYRVTNDGSVEVGGGGDGESMAVVPATLPKTVSSAVGAKPAARWAPPKPGVFGEQAGQSAVVHQALPPSASNLRDVYGPLISAAAEVYRVDENLLRAVIWQESRFKDRAVSRAGAKGLMQLMPGTARDLQVADVYDPIQNVAGGARYLQTLLLHYGGNPELALAAYNAGQGAVRRYQGIPPYRETRRYIEAIRARLAAAVARYSVNPSTAMLDQ